MNDGTASDSSRTTPAAPASTKFRLAVVNSHPIQYLAPLYAYLNATPELEVTALYCSDYSLRGGVDPGFRREITWDVDMLTGYRSVFLGARAGTRSPVGFWSLVCPELWRELRRERYDGVVIHGNQFAAYVLGALIARLRRMAVFHRCDTTTLLTRSRARRFARDAVLRVYYTLFDGFLAMGTLNRQFYTSLGVREDRIFLAPYSVDNARFIAAATIDASERAAIRRSYGLPDDLPVVLHASKLQRRKHADDLLRAVAILRNEGLTCPVLLIGTGEMEGQLRRLAERLALDNVVFGGFVNQATLPKIYAATDVFVLPSESEPWGSVVNEVMCAGRPVVVAHGVGCVPDLVQDGVNGRLVPPRDPPALAAALRSLLTDPGSRARMGAASLDIIRRWDYESCRQGILEAIRQTATNGR